MTSGLIRAVGREFKLRRVTLIFFFPNLRDPPQCKSCTWQVHDIPVDQVSRLPRGRKLSFVVVEAAEAEEKIEALKHSVDRVFFRCGLLAFLEPGHGCHT